MQFWQISTLCHPIVLSSIFAPAQKGQFYLKYLKTSKTSPVGGVALLINIIFALSQTNRLFKIILIAARGRRVRPYSRNEGAPECRVGTCWCTGWFTLSGRCETRSINQFYRSVYTSIHSNTLRLSHFLSIIDCVSRFNLRMWAEVSQSWTKRTSGITVV